MSIFNDLCSKFNPNSSDLFHYFQVRHFVNAQSSSFPNTALKSPADSLLEVPLHLQGLVSRIYATLMSLKSVGTDKIRSRWEKELGVVFSEEFICARFNLIQFKVLHRMHLSRTRIASFNPTFDKTCIRCHTGEADLIHMFWTCPTLTIYWSTIFDTLSKVWEVQLKPCAEFAISGVPDDESNLTPRQLNIIAFASLFSPYRILREFFQIFVA